VLDEVDNYLPHLHFTLSCLNIYRSFSLGLFAKMARLYRLGL
jgi:hypothetical protein